MNRRRLLFTSAIAALALVGSGCGDAGTSSGVSTVTVTASTMTSSSAVPATTAPTDQSGPTDQTGTVDAARYQQEGGYFFVSPSGKFHCGIISNRDGRRAAAGCHGKTQPVPPRPASCPQSVGWGRGLQVYSDGEVSFVCTGGVIYGPGTGVEPPALDYGRRLSATGFTCTTATSGVTCKSDASGHGFTIADNTNTTF